jgi:hypothetical protein
MDLHLKTLAELSARIRELLQALEARHAGILRVASCHRQGELEYWLLAFLYVDGMRYDVDTHELRHLPLADQTEDLLRQLAEFSPTTVALRLSKMVAALTPQQRRQFTSLCKLLSGLPKGAQPIFWTSPKGSLAGLTPLEALVAGRYGEVRRTAKGYAER